jgi:hypothetical protein
VLGGGEWTNGGNESSSCIACPYGGDCSRGGQDVGAQAGFFGVADAVTGDLAFTLCAPAYCCANTSGFCGAYDACVGNRTGMLCGECAAGYSEVLGSPLCRATSGCSDLAWFAPLCLTLGSLLAGYFLLAGSDSSGTVNILTYFYQIAPFMQLDSSGAASAMTAISTWMYELFQLQPGGGSSAGVCIRGMTAVQKEAFYFLLPLFVFVPLLALVFALRSAKRSGWDGGSCCSLAVPKLVRLRLRPVLQRDVRVSFSAAMLKLGLYTYSIVALHALVLLRCVPIAGLPGIYLLTAAYVECYQPWQKLLIFLVVLLFAAPLMLGWILWRSAQGAVASPLVDMMAAPYRDGAAYWESVLLCFRMLVVVVYTAVTNAVVALLSLSLFSMLQLIVHLRYRPFRTNSAQDLQTFCIACLAMLATLSFPPATLTMNASAVVSSTAGFLNAFGVLQFVLLVLPLVFLSANRVWMFLTVRRNNIPLIPEGGSSDKERVTTPSESRPRSRSVSHNRIQTGVELPSITNSVDQVTQHPSALPNIANLTAYLE